MDIKIESYCGLSCASCGECEGCKPSYAEYCGIAACCVQRGIRFCGECGDYPCEKLSSTEFGPKAVDCKARIANCQAWKFALVAQAREGLDPVSVCGHHCDYCFYGKFCGGCRSNYNGCSYATIFTDRKCPNVTCARERGYDGCYDCTELDGCTKGYYSVQNEYVCKATARFIRRYGKESYTATLQNAIAQGADYPKSFDATGSVDAALALLETFRP